MAEKKMTLFANGKQHQVYVYSNVAGYITDVCLAGDLMSIKNKLTPKQMNSIHRRLRKA